MRWKRKEKIIPKDGEERIIRRFPIIPVYINNEYRWLESVIILQRYLACEYIGFGDWIGFKWVNVRYLDREEAAFYKTSINTERGGHKMNKRQRKKLANKEYKKLGSRMWRIDYNQKFDPYIEGQRLLIIKTPKFMEDYIQKRS